MSALTANLKYTIGHKWLWPVYAFLALFLGFFVFVSAHAKHDRKLIGICIAYVLLISANFGGIVAARLIETLTKPVTFTLPNHRTMVRMVLFMMEGIVLLISTVVLVSSGLSGMEVVRTGLILMAVSSLGYWWAAFLGFTWGRPSGLPFLSLPLLIILTIGTLRTFDTVQRILIQYQIAVIPLALVVNFLAWRRLRDSERLRDFIRRRTLIRFSLWWRSRYCDASDLWGKRTTPGLTRRDQFILERMRASSPSGIARYVWGELYCGTPWLTKGKGTVVFIGICLCLAALILGYLFDSGEMLRIYIMVAVIPCLSSAQLNMYSTLLLARGRRERFVVTLTKGFNHTISLSCIISIPILLTMLFAPAMPSFRFGGHNFVFHAMPIQYCYFPLFFAAQGLAWSLLSRGRMIAALPVWCLNTIGIFMVVNRWGLLFTLGSWVFLILVSYWISRKWSLVRT